MHFNVAENTIFLTLAGSHAYGMATESSDVDTRGVCVAPMDVRLSYFKKFEQYQGPLDADLVKSLRNCPQVAKFGEDNVIYDLAKAIRLMADGNPNMLELLWVPDSCVLKTSPVWEKFVVIREHFLSLKCKYTFMGYAHAQYRKIASHRSWLLNPPTTKPERQDFGLDDHVAVLSADDRNRIEEAVVTTIRSWQIEDLLKGSEQDTLRERMLDFWCSCLEEKTGVTVERGIALDDAMKTLAGQASGLREETLTLLSAERRYRAALKHWNSYLKWKTERNPQRAEMEARWGFDLKHASHLVRLSRMCVEILRDGVVLVRRPDADELLAIRRGERSFEDIEQEFKRLEQEVEEVAKVSRLPKTANHALLDQTLIQVLRGSY